MKTQSKEKKMARVNFTEKGGVKTTRGFIPHLKHESGQFEMPVKVKRPNKSLSGLPRPPILCNDFIVFALPGGGEYFSTLTIDSL